MNKTLIQFKREFWENRASFMVTPFVLSAVVVGLLLLGIVPLQSKIADALPDFKVDLEFDLDDADEPTRIQHFPEQGDGFALSHELLTHGFATIYSIFNVVLLLVVASYFVSALYNDRRDKSILFWKSLPVSEWKNVLTKLGAGTLGAPLFYAAAALLAGAASVLIIMVYAGLVWNIPTPSLGSILAAYFSSAVGLVLGWLLVSLWLLPVYCWLLLCSAVARKAPFLLAIGVPLALIVLEAWVFGGAKVAHIVKAPLSSGGAAFQEIVHMPSRFGTELLAAFSAPAMWLGLIVSAVLLAACVWLRTFKYEI